jgi:hypothetical protein
MSDLAVRAKAQQHVVVAQRSEIATTAPDSPHRAQLPTPGRQDGEKPRKIVGRWPLTVGGAVRYYCYRIIITV